jgi:hypothetical protein
MGPRSEARRQEHAATWDHAGHVGRALGLGEPLGLYRAEILPPLGARRVLRLLSPIPVALLVALLIVPWRQETVIAVLALSPIPAGLYGAAVLITAQHRGRFTRWLYAYPAGLAELDPKAPPRPLRWDTITDAVDEWTSSGSESQSLWDYEGFRLTASDGRTVLITARYVNVLDPYGPAGSLIASLLPAGVGATIPRLPSIVDLVLARAVTPVATRLAASIRAGAVITRGDLRLSPDGISGPKDTTPLPWATIERADLRPGRLRLRLATGKTRTYDNYRDGSGYAVLTRVLLALGVPAAYEG